MPGQWIRMAICALTALTALGLTSRIASAQAPGMGNLLNPEGSRLFPQSFTVPRHPGKPDPRWIAFDWKYSDIETAGNRMRLYFYEDEEEVARFAIPRIREQIKYLSDQFDFRPKKTFTYILFTSRQEWRQADIFFVNEGVQGITNPVDLTMAVPYWGETDTFDHISLHEMVHQFEVQKIMHLSEKAEKPYYMALQQFPLWFIEGMAEYYSQYGIDAEARMYVRDLLVHADPDQGYTAAGFFEPGPMSFVHTYKLGQAKIDFIEKKFGDGSAQRLLEAVASDPEGFTFDSIFAKLFDVLPSRVEKDWLQYLDQEYLVEAKSLTQDVKEFELIRAAGDTLDYYDVSPDGALLATREIDPILGVSSVQVMDLTAGTPKKVRAASDRKPGTLTLHFFELPSVAVGNGTVAYVAGTSHGPEIEYRRVLRGRDGGAPSLGPAHRLEVHEHGIVEAHSLAISPDETDIAFVGLSRDGKPNIFRMPLPDREEGAEPRSLVKSWYAWQHLEWRDSGIYGASDQTREGQFNLFRVDPDSGESTRLTSSGADQLAPDFEGGDLYFQSNQSGSEQIHVLRHDGTQTRLTDGTTGLSHPKRRGSHLYTLGFAGGRFHLFRVPASNRLSLAVPTRPVSTEAEEPAWQPTFASLPEAEVNDYRAFRSSGMRLENLGAFFGSGAFGGAAAQVSDLMRTYWIDAEFFFFGNIRFTNSSFFFSSQRGRATWTLGGYHIAEPRLDNVFNDKAFRTYLRREYGALGAIQYPLTAFSFVGGVLRVGGVNRSDFSDPLRLDEWEAVNPGGELIIAPTLRLGYDRLLYEMFAGPLKGFGTMLESETSYFPARGELNQRLRLDIAYYQQVLGRSTLVLQGLAGGSWGGPFRDPYFVSSDDILRGYAFADERLRGNFVLAGKVETRFPIGTLFGFPPLRGLAAYDFGTVFRRKDRVATNFSTSTSGGLQFNLPPLSLSFILSFPGRVAPGPEVDSPVFHFTLRYLYL